MVKSSFFFRLENWKSVSFEFSDARNFFCSKNFDRIEFMVGFKQICNFFSCYVVYYVRTAWMILFPFGYIVNFSMDANKCFWRSIRLFLTIIWFVVFLHFLPREFFHFFSTNKICPINIY
jgi:hypothetical protein